MNELWLPVLGFEEYYMVSNLGNVKSLDRKVWNGKTFYLKKGRTLKQSNTSTGYKMVAFSVDGRSKYKKVHRVVLEAFVGVCDLVTNHKDGNPENNRLDNLEYCTQKENVIHAIENNLKVVAYKKFEKEIVEDYQKGLTQKEITKKYKTSFASIQKILKKNNIRIKTNHEQRIKYDIDLQELKRMIDEGWKNKEIANYFNAPSELIATRKYQYKKGVI